MRGGGEQLDVKKGNGIEKILGFVRDILYLFILLKIPFQSLSTGITRACKSV